jgi:hypothetical protein
MPRTKKEKSEQEIFYVYVYLDPRKPGKYSYCNGNINFDYEPFYVGKGYGDRSSAHIREVDYLEEHQTLEEKGNKHKRNKIRKIRRIMGRDPIIILYEQGIEEEISFHLECLLIAKIGRYDKGLGPLTNMTDGGDGVRGRVLSEEELKRRKDMWTPELRQRHSEKCKGRPSPMKGKHNPCSPEQALKISLANKGKPKPEGFGEKVSKASKGVPKSKEHVQNVLKSKKQNFDNLSPEEKDIQHGLISQRSKDARDRMTEEEKIEIGKKIAKSWSSKSNDERDVIHQRQQETRKNKSVEQKAAISKQLSDSWWSKSEEERKEIVDRQIQSRLKTDYGKKTSQTWKDMSPERRKEIGINISKSRKGKKRGPYKKKLQVYCNVE